MYRQQYHMEMISMPCCSSAAGCLVKSCSALEEAGLMQRAQFCIVSQAPCSGIVMGVDDGFLRGCKTAEPPAEQVF